MMARHHLVDCSEHFVVGDYGIEVSRIGALYGVLTHLLNLLLEEQQVVHLHDPYSGEPPRGV
jgi:hypothetical protein